MKNVICIFILPNELDELHGKLQRLQKSLTYLANPTEWSIDVVMCTADDIINWKASKLSKNEIITSFDKIKTEFCRFVDNFSTSDQIRGCTDYRRDVIKKYKNADYFLWLDVDIVFPESALFYLTTSINTIHGNYPYSIITPELVRLWDTTWDCLVNHTFLDKPLNYQKTNDPFIDCGRKGEISLESVDNPTPKFAGGWFTCLSGRLLRRIGIPDNFAPYGLEDTFIMHAAAKLTKLGKINAVQFKIKNLVVCENYRYRNVLDNVALFDRRDEFIKITSGRFDAELKTLS